MNDSLIRFNHRAKAILCLTLVVAMHVVVGCGGAPSLFPESGNLIPLTPDHPMAQALAGTPFSSATAVEVNAATNQFRLVFPDGAQQQISGTFSFDGGKAYVSRLTVAEGAMSATVSFAANQQITSINTSAGPSWARPGEDVAKVSLAASNRPNTVDSFLEANADLMEAAQEFDSQGVVTSPIGGPANEGATGGQTVKTGTAFGPLAFVFAMMIFIPLGIGATIIFLIELVVAATALV
ncbi:MAG TPA: hypothetical protein VJZ71_12405 [Phycisphaerae bacterium]|nr:hypothetical protein [Phycisphaerae bacterium]